MRRVLWACAATAITVPLIVTVGAWLYEGLLDDASYWAGDE